MAEMQFRLIDLFKWMTVTAVALALATGLLTGFVGANTNLGLWAIDTFNPDLPPQDFQPSFGVTVGTLAGAFLGALLGGIAGNLRRRQSP